MKKILTFLLIPLLFLTMGTSNLFLLNNNGVNINQDDRIIDLSLGNNHSGMTVDTNEDGQADTLYMWGNNSDGQIGDGSTSTKNSPTIITPSGQTDWGGDIIDLSLGSYYSGVTIDTNEDGQADTLYMWGSDQNGKIGNGSSSSDVLSPTIITPSGETDWGGDIIDLSLGGYHSGLTIDTNSDGQADTLYMWGNNSDGQIGDGSTSIKNSPTIITPSGETDWDGDIIDLSLGDFYSGLTIDTNSDGQADTLYMWGDNSSGQIGNGTTKTDVLNPTMITPSGQTDWGGDIIDLSLGDLDSGVVIDTDLDNYADTLYTWGSNIYGEIGDGSTSSFKSSPTMITPSGQTDWGGDIIDLSLGGRNSGAFIDTNNDHYADTLYMWGHNSNGQIGDGTTSDRKTPIKITPQNKDNWGGDIIDLSLGNDYTGIIIDTNNDHYADTLYMWGVNTSGQLGDGTNSSESYPELITSIYPFFFETIDFYYKDNNNIEFKFKLDDYQNIINEAPEVTLIDNENNNYTTTFIDSKSNIANDEYYYEINNIAYGKKYTFTSILINDNQFNLSEDEIQTDYLISDYNFISSTEETETISLNLDQNSEDFNISDYTEDQRKIKVNYTSIDNNVSNSQQFTLDQTNQITLINLNAETNYRIDSIDYFYEDNNYKYTIEQEIKIFQTNPATPLINADSIELIDNSVTTDSFQYTIEIDNLKQNSNEDNFTQYNINDGIWLIDDNGVSYNSSFISEKLISNGEINGTQNYQLTFLQEDLTSGQTYNFTGIGFNDPNGSDPDTINFSSSFEVKTILINKKFVDNTFAIDQNSITTNSFEYSIVIDDLVLIDNTEENPTFSNFDLNEMLYLKDQNNNIFSSSYVNDSALSLGTGEEEGTVKYQFTFKVNNLKENTTYNFVSLSFTENFEESIDISASGTITTNDNANEKIVIWVIIVILIIFILLILILIWVDLKMKKRTKEIAKALDNPDKF